MLAVWSEQRAAHGEDLLIVTRRNADASALNIQARAVLRAEGRLGPDLVTLPARDRDDRPVPLALAVGDGLRFGENLPHLGLRNGNRARVEALTVEPDGEARLRLALEDGGTLEVAWPDLAQQPRFGRKRSQPRIMHAYAGTAYAAQGRTSSATVMYVGAVTDAREIYVGLTRHRHEARVVVERDRLDALCRQRQEDARMPATDAMVLERLFREARTYSEKANVVDHAADRIAFVRDGSLETRELIGQGVDVRRLMRATRLLRVTMAWLGVEQLIVPAWQLVDAYGRRLTQAPAQATRALVDELASRFSRPDPLPERERSHQIER
ncbi:hypothetical protein BK022_01830 [Methylorubrum extorquens]|uniref:Uncharacterized protein n=1 Tax=Methylorubrum extorquens TaxID=408 RepID=A0A1S1PAQ0_METEX|nr:hypothetical protein BK022_01830 [Methylorubrum extorquens]